MPVSGRELLGAEDGAKAIVIVDIVVVHVGASVVAGYAGVIVVVLLGKPFCSATFLFCQMIFFKKVHLDFVNPKKLGEQNCNSRQKFAHFVLTFIKYELWQKSIAKFS